MGTKSSKTGFPEFFVDTTSPESVQREFIDAPMKAVLQSGFGPALEVANLLRILPDAFAASQRSELDRIKQSADKNDPRIAAMEASIEQVDDLRRVVRLAEIRTRRSLIAIVTRTEIFHGFVSDSHLNPLKGLTVQVSAGKGGAAKDLSATTDADGYFSIPLGKTKSTRPTEEEAANITPEQIAELFARQEKERDDKDQLKQETGREIRVEILKKGKLLHEDPVPIVLEDGNIYREYVLRDEAPPSKPDSEKSPSSPGYKSTTSPGDSKEHATKASQASSGNEPPSSASSRSAAKKSARSAKSTTKRTSKK